MRNFITIVEELNQPPFEPYTPDENELAAKYGVDVSEIEEKVARGIEQEGHHTTDTEIAREIALDHLAGDLSYYDEETH